MQALLEKEGEGEREQDSEAAVKLLGQDKQHLYPKIFQLVVAETACRGGERPTLDRVACIAFRCGVEVRGKR